MAQNLSVKDVFVILRLADGVDEIVERVRNAGYKPIVDPKNVDMKTEPVFPIRVTFIEGPLHESIELFCEKA